MNNHPEILFDLSYLRSIDPDDVVFLRNIISDFIENTPLAIDKMNFFLRAKDWDGLCKTAHKLKPDLACIGAASAEKIISEIETLSHGTQKLNLLPDLIDKLTTDCNLICEGLKAELKTKGK